VLHTSASVILTTLVGLPPAIGRHLIRLSVEHSRSQFRQVPSVTNRLAIQRACTTQRSVRMHRRTGPTSNGCKCSRRATRPIRVDHFVRTDHPIANLWPFSTNNTCPPTSDPSEPCTRGFYGNYVIMATTKDQIKAGVDFARERNLRLIVRNTGHDFM
jgi:hypothetical protein